MTIFMTFFATGRQAFVENKNRQKSWKVKLIRSTDFKFEQN